MAGRGDSRQGLPSSGDASSPTAGMDVLEPDAPGILDVIRGASPAGDEKDTKVVEETTAHELGSLLGCGSLEVAIQDRAPNDDSQREHNKLDGKHMGRIEVF